MCTRIILLLTLCLAAVGLTDCASSYDQRQTGDLNVQIGLKNIELIALLNKGKEDYVDYDYAYDYSEMTIKPQNGVTHKPLNVPNPEISATTSAAVADNSNISNGTATTQSINNTETITHQPADTGSANYSNDVSTTTEFKLDLEQGEEPVVPNLASSASPLTVINCRRGFIKNNQGKCEYKIHGTTNALRRIVKLAQKIKIGRGITET